MSPKLIWAMTFEVVCFLKKGNRFLRVANLISVNLQLSISIDKSYALSIELQFSLYNGFVFLKPSFFLVQPVFIKYS